ncbi:M48 family metallopeptidase [Marinimicrobium agarilyticum]|uniref:M48 family metallopeptidase n=1 Tax=Marinimicrobium agarilyticum TaxID=306546 RepID=UPI000421D088|nr:M48 family metallopeptidase [Marinimicrobium agarilyticum]
MDFFEHQELARRNTRRLVILMTFAVLSLIVLTTLLFALTTAGIHSQTVQAGSGFWSGLLNRIGWQTVAWIALLVGAMVLIGSLFKWFQLRSGGQAVAEALGGQLIPANTGDFAQRRLLNIVEEMAIASGTPVPPVYQLSDESINAFAAGHGPHDAVIGITRGCMEQLNREELQGVIAHEFSHILHGDMRLNLRLVAVLNGILLIGLLGHVLLRGGAHRVGHRRGRNQGNIALIGLGLIVLGAMGTFFGNWIKAAVSRQREFLADASAVQYTRNPQGIGGALMKIGGLPSGSRLSASDANEFSHMYFEEGVAHRFTRMMATHPPLEERVRRVMPQWDGAFPAPGAPSELAPDTTGEPRNAATEAASGFAAAGEPVTPSKPDEPAAREPDSEALDHARTLLSALPQSVQKSAREPFSARAVLLGLALPQGQQKDQWQALNESLPREQLKQLTPLIRESAALPESARLPTIELALPSLRQLSAPQKTEFLETLDRMIRADGQIHLREWVVYRLVQTHLSAKPSQPQRLKLRFCQKESELILALAALSGSRSDAQAQAAFAAGARELGAPLQWPERERLTFTQMDRALERLRQLLPLEKPVLLKALRRCLQNDNAITPTEAELYRALADTLDCPTPPLRTVTAQARLSEPG